MRMTDRKRKAILDAAVDEFVASGYDGTSMDQIATSADVSKRTVYKHFASKEELFAEIIHNLVGQIESVPEFTYDSKRSLANQLEAIALEIVQAVSDPGFLSLARVIVSRLIVAPEFSQFMSEQTARIDARLADWLQLAHSDGRVQIPQADVAAEQLMGLLLSYAFWPALLGIRRQSRGQPQQAYVKQCVKMFLSAYMQS
ncbi:HTH-type transcriptional regulator RutR [Novipirellula aureliae]|uniref:HTH-type transcriptional regulator RutR n=2 Tax=Novipirellula aureliae TaxID=2527966 RepID=A0A5C6E3E7_9BACT|nr:HTH-type transcriptional regulator RutR [Novipirellula aureliae]